SQKALFLQRAQRLPPRIEGEIDVGLRVGGGSEPATRALQIHAVVEHRDAQLPEHALVLAFQRLRRDRGCVEGGRAYRLAPRIRMNVEERVLAVDGPRHPL